MANKQIIFVVETNEKKKTDDIYINKFIRSYYDLSNNDITIKFVHMCGKTNYKNKTVVTKINKLINQNSKGENIVIYCFDTDRIDKEIDDLKFLKVNWHNIISPSVIYYIISIPKSQHLRWILIKK